ncbi:MAG: O-antigen ligase family protein [Lachnospiraceae bacterium]|nr:O-antigen ligase family protein [Lachnospiraceae bacterium]
MYAKLKQCKSLKELYETIPEAFYEKSSVVMFGLMLFMIVHETVIRFVMRYQNFFGMVDFYYYIGYAGILLSVFIVAVRAAGAGKDGIRTYFKKNLYEILFVIMMIWGLLATLQSSDVKTAFLGDWFRQGGYRSFLIFAAFYILGKQIKNRKAVMIVYFAMLLVSSMQNLLLVTNELGYYGTKVGAFMNTNHSAYFMTMVAFAAVGFVSLCKKISGKIVGLILYVFNIGCLIWNNTFGCYLAVVAGFVFLIALSVWKKRRLLKELLLALILFIVVSFLIDYQTGIVSNNFGITSNDIGKIASKTEDAKNAGNGRWELWMDAMNYTINHPLFGSGPDYLTNETIRIEDESGKMTERMVLSEPHNEYLQYAAEWGVPALVCYLGGLALLLVAKIKSLKKSEDSVLYNGTIVFVYCVSAFFGVIMFYTAIYFFYYLGMTSRWDEYI